MDHTLLKRILGSVIVVLMLTILIAALTFYGVISASLGRVCLGLAFVIGVGGIVFSEWVWRKRPRDKLVFGAVAALLWGSALIWLDSWAIKHAPAATGVQAPSNSPGLVQQLPTLGKQIPASPLGIVPRKVVLPDCRKEAGALAQEILSYEYTRLTVEKEKEQKVGPRSEAMQAFIEHTERITDTTYPHRVSDLLPNLEKCGIPVEKIRTDSVKGDDYIVGFELEKIAENFGKNQPYRRHLTDQMRKFLVLRLRDFVDETNTTLPRPAIQIFAQREDKESFEFARSISEAAREAGWIVLNDGTLPDDFGSQDENGVIASSGRVLTRYGEWDGLADDLELMGFRVVRSNIRIPEQNTIKLYVGPQKKVNE